MANVDQVPADAASISNRRIGVFGPRLEHLCFADGGIVSERNIGEGIVDEFYSFKNLLQIFVDAPVMQSDQNQQAGTDQRFMMANARFTHSGPLSCSEPAIYRVGNT